MKAVGIHQREGKDIAKKGDLGIITTDDTSKYKVTWDRTGLAWDVPKTSWCKNFEVVSKALLCVSRVPQIGDTVRGLAGTLLHTADGRKDAWELQPGEVAIVVGVDYDHDFRLKNPIGLVSGWTYRSDYAYEEAPHCISLEMR